MDEESSINVSHFSAAWFMVQWTLPILLVLGEKSCLQKDLLPEIRKIMPFCSELGEALDIRNLIRSGRGLRAQCPFEHTFSDTISIVYLIET